jgi:aminopeptidase N
MARLDPHSYYDSDQPVIEHLDWRARVDFDARVIEAEATLQLASAADGPFDLDTRELTILDVSDGDQPLQWELHAPEPILGARLTIDARGPRVRIRYRTSPSASALQWLAPAQTAGGRHPFLFSQCQAIHARSVVPLQDSPRVRIRYHAEVSAPPELRVLMAAAFVAREGGVEIYDMPQPIPPYLFALAVGDLASRELGPRSRVWAEPSVVERAAWEFAGVDAMLRTAESLFGPYAWERFDILTMPPSFPYGGMENPRLTFLTPTLLAGDRSLVNVVAHELAHSWTGNLVSNADAEHFWLNEGFTVFAERRILEALAEGGPELTALHAALGRRDLERALARFAKQPELTRLRTHLAGVDPDEAFSEIPYEKGYLFLRAIEEAAGRAAFDRFLKKWVEELRFRAVTTDDFVAFVERELPGALAVVHATSWLDAAGVPADAPRASSSRLEAIRALEGALPSPEMARAWTPTEWQLWLESLPRPVPAPLRAEIESRFKLSESENHEVLVTWLERLAEAGDRAAHPRIEATLARVGRMKYLRPLYTALARTDEGRAFARECFARHRAGYHPIAQQVVEALLA